MQETKGLIDWRWLTRYPRWKQKINSCNRLATLQTPFPVDHWIEDREGPSSLGE